MATIELRMSLLQEVMSLEGEKLIKKALNSVRCTKMVTFDKTTPVEEPASGCVEPTKGEILVGLRNTLQDVKNLCEGKDMGCKLRDLNELFSEI